MLLCRRSFVALLSFVLLVTAGFTLHLHWIALRYLSSPVDVQAPPDVKTEKADEGSHDNVRVFLGIKSSEKGVHGKRLPQIQKTWLIDVLETDEVDIRSFTHSDANQREGMESSDGLESLMVTTPCKARDLNCKTGAMFAYFLDHYPRNTTFFCNFDDDNYVLVHNLQEVLTSYGYQRGPTQGQNIYVGRQFPNRQLKRKGNVPLYFHTGGAGYCLSRDLVERGRQHFTALQTVKGTDDVAVGYVVQFELGVKLIEDKRFHSHLEQGLKSRLLKDDITRQVSFGYNNKYQGNRSAGSFPNIPIIFRQEEDPLLFRSLRCFLLKQESNALVPECKPAQQDPVVGSNEDPPKEQGQRSHASSTAASSASLPGWVEDYFRWHASQLKKLNPENWNTSRYLILRCVDTKLHQCGGTADRLLSVPYAIKLAASSKRLFFIHWVKPAPLEEFLVPSDLNWTVPVWLLPELMNEKVPLVSNNDTHQVVHQSHIVVGLPYLQLFKWYVYHNVDETAINYRVIWDRIFHLNPAVEAKLRQAQSQLGLQPGNYVAAHARTRYNSYRAGNKTLITNAVNCATSLSPNLPVYFASDSKRATETAVKYGALARLSDSDPLHIDRGATYMSLDNSWSQRTAEEYYDIFVDLYLLGGARCVASGKGGYGKWGRLLSSNYSCHIDHEQTHCPAANLTS